MTVASQKILILGGYGTFGGRLAQLLADEQRLTLVIAGRSLAKAERFCAALPSKATLLPAVFDRAGDAERQLREIAPDIVVDASGPFQQYVGDPYGVVRAAIALGISYLDLSDGAAFVRGITQFDAAARQRNVFVLSGVSSCPVLTAAAVRRLAVGLTHIDSIAGGIAPSPFAKVGLNVIRAIAGYAGQPVTLVRDGRPATGHALIDSIDYTIAPPGRLPLRRIRFSLVEVPDLDVLPELWPDVRSVWMGAGTVPKIWHRMLNAFAWTVRLRILPSLLPFAGMMHRTLNTLTWGEHRGGMFVAVRGTTAEGAAVERSWHMVAEENDGPFIPAMAAEAVIRHILAGRVPAPGARAAVKDLELDDYERLFARKRIASGIRQRAGSDQRLPLYRRVLGDAYASLPQPLQAIHDVQQDVTVNGVAAVERGRGLLSRVAAWLIGFPPAGKDVSVSVTFRPRDGREVWHRNFAGRKFMSVQEEGRDRNEWLVCERFGPLVAAMALVLDGERLRLVIRRWSAFGLPLPLALAPRINAYEFAESGRFHFHVEIAHPFTGPIVGYHGWLVPR